MKKFNLLVALLLVVSLASVFAQDEEAAAPTLGGLHGVTGSVSFSFGDDDLNGGDGLAFSSTKDGSTTADVTAMVATDAVEAGVTVSLVPEITLNKNDDSVSRSDTDLDFDIAQSVIDWYDDASGDNYDGLQEVDWEVTLGDTDVYTDADGFTDDNISTLAEWNAAKALTNSVFTTAIAGIDALDTTPSIGITYADVTANGSWYVDQYGNIRDGGDAIQVTDATDAQIAKMEAVNEASADYDAVFGSNEDDTWSASYPVSNAYLRLKALFGVVDVEFQVNGKAIAVGSKFNVAEDDANLGVSLGLTSGVVEGVSASVLYTLAESTAATGEDKETLAVEAADGSDAVSSVELNGGYATDMFNVDVELGLVDFNALTTSYSLRGGLSLADLYGLSVGAELTGVADADGSGLGVAADLGASIMGIAPSVDFRLNSNLYGDADTKDDGTALEYFDTADEDNTYLGVGVTVDAAELIGMNLVSVNGGLGMVFGGNSDWNAGVDFTFADFGAPVTAGFSVASMYDSTLTWKGEAGLTVADVMFGVYLADEAGDNLAYGVTLDYTYDVLGIAASFTSDKDGVQAIDVTVSTSF